MMNKSYQQGFGLVELMVALVIGLVIVLGAGQLFLTGFQSFRKIEDLSIKQSALMFAADVLLRDIRRAESDSIVLGNSTLTLVVDGDSVEYSMAEGGRDWSLLKNSEPVVDGFEDSASFDVAELSAGVYEVTFNLVEENALFVFQAVNRTEALK